jgi:dTDP-glucose pyrophosphorylase
LKAVILARGLGTRMRAADSAAQLTAEQRAAADVGMKAMIDVGRPFLDFVISALADAGFRDVCLVIGPEHDAIREHYRAASPKRVSISYAIQERPLGTANAVLAAERFVGSDAFVVLNADNYYSVDVLRLLREQSEPALPAFHRDALLRESNIAADRIAKYALLEIDADGYLRRVIEKPDERTLRALGNASVSMNLWRLTPEIFEACRNVPPSSRAEVELPNAVQWAIEHLRYRVRAIPVRAGVLDLSQRADIPAVAERLRTVTVSL